MRIRWTVPAARALEAIVDHVAADDAEAADRIAQRIRVAVERLGEYPKLGRTGRIRGSHELVIHGLPYVVPYRVRRGEIQVLNVYHTSRKWPDRFD